MLIIFIDMIIYVDVYKTYGKFAVNINIFYLLISVKKISFVKSSIFMRFYKDIFSK